MLFNCLFLLLGIWAFNSLVGQIDFKEFKGAVFSYRALFTVLLATFFAYYFRVKRWKMVLENRQKKQKGWQIASAMFYGYFINLALPRAGEITKAAIYQKYSGLKLPFIIGTIVLDRLIDILVLLVLLVVYSFLDHEIYISFYHKWITNTPIDGLLKWQIIFPLSILFITSLFIFWRFVKPILQVEWSNFSEGLFAIAHLKQLPLFVLYTLGIWTCYFFTSYGCFGFLKTDLGLRAGFALLVLGSFARSIPIQAGAIGVYHYTVILVLTLPIFAESEGNSVLIAAIIHGIQTGVQIIMGVISLIINSIKLRN